jgi:hypothetical protein
VIDLVGTANLVVENDPDSLPTFETANGRSWIDVTFSRDATVEDWEVREKEILSHHRGISFSITTEEERTDREIDGKRFLMTTQRTGISSGKRWSPAERRSRMKRRRKERPQNCRS